ncbi:MAG TPA: molybdopterin-dependent oxidoreductase, partial [Anaerolineales bacterium]
SPKVRKYILDGTVRPQNRGPWVEVDWDTALNIAAQGLRSRRDQYGPSSIGVLASGRCLNEENYLVNKLARQVLGTNNIDCCEHAQHSSIVEGMDAAIGLSCVSNPLEDVADHAQAVLVIGSNTTEQHPIFGVKLRRAVLRRGCHLVVASSDFINMSEYAALRLTPRPGTQAALVNGLMYIILEKGWENREFIENHTRDFDAFRLGLKGFTPAEICKRTGVEEEQLYRAAEILATHRPMAVVWGSELVGSADPAPNVQSLVNLQLLLGNLGMPGGGVIPLRSQNNSQGGHDMGGSPAFYPGYQPAASDATRKKFEAAWGRGVATRPGLTAMEMLAAAAEGKLRALYVLGGDIVSGAANAVQVRHSLRNCDFVVLQEVFDSETSRSADVLLPGATFAEKTGTFTSTERRIQMVRQAIAPQGQSRPDWQVIAELARRIRGDGAPGEYAEWDYRDTSAILAEIAALTPIYAGVSHERLERLGSLQWPVKHLNHPGTAVLGPESFPGGHARFMVEAF